MLLAIILFLPITLSISNFMNIKDNLAHATISSERLSTDNNGIEWPTISDPKLHLEKILDGLDFPTGIAFLGPNDILVTEKNKGTVLRILNGERLEEPLLHVNVSNQGERGMLGIAVSHGTTPSENKTYVFLYYTESKKESGADKDGGETTRNRIYRYELINNKLINPKPLLELPSTDQYHNGGKIVIGPDKDLYVTMGDLDRVVNDSSKTAAQNIKGVREPDGTGGILRITQDGKVVQGDSILGEGDPLNKYYAYGIRNSFGIGFDPVTGNLWDTENGPDFGDEINLVKPGFNSGWEKVQGIWKLNQTREKDGIFNESDKDVELVDFNGKGKYSNPEFVWQSIAGPSAIKFLNSDKLGKKYENNLFVGDFHNGNLYHFDLNEDRTELSLHGALEDKLGDTPEELENVTLGKDFGGITDIEVGPDNGYLYVLSLHEGGQNCAPGLDSDCIRYNSTIEGVIFRITVASNN